jgi:membrane protein required for colicin V production
MTAFDYAVISVVALSMLLGWWRGLVYEAVSLLSWLAAYLVARMFAEDVMDDLPQVLGTEAARMAVSFALLFVLTLVLGGFLAWALNRMVKAAGMERLDGSLGALFGLLRGLILVLALVLLAGMTGLPQTPVWRDAWMSSALEEIAVQTRALLPDGLAQKIHYQH